MKKSVLLVLLLANLPIHAGTVAEPAPASPDKPRYSFLDPIGDFARDSIIDPKTPFELVPGKNPDGWSFVLEPYAWAMGLSGDVGIKGLPAAHVEASSLNILRNLNWAIFMRGEIRKGR
jgi:hypothetical protein